VLVVVMLSGCCEGREMALRNEQTGQRKKRETYGLLGAEEAARKSFVDGSDALSKAVQVDLKVKEAVISLSGGIFTSL
jgi:type II secretory pathway component PulK